MDFVQPHVGKAVVIRIDLRSFFQSIRAGRVNAVWRALGYPEEVARTLTALTTHAPPPDVVATFDASQRPALRTPHLPQGAPTSPALANLIAFGDIALSGDANLSRAADEVVVTMTRIATDEGFVVNPQKTRVQRRSVRQKLAGVVVNVTPQWSRPERERFEATLVNCVRLGPTTQNRRELPDFRAHLAGRLAWLAQVSPHVAAEMRPIFDAIEWP